MPLGRYCSQNCHLMVPAVNKVSVKLDSCQSAWCFLVPSILLFPTPSLSPFPLTPSILPLLHVCLPSALPLTPFLPPWLPTFLPLAPSISLPASFTPSLALHLLTSLPPTPSLPQATSPTPSLTLFLTLGLPASLPPIHSVSPSSSLFTPSFTPCLFQPFTIPFFLPSILLPYDNASQTVPLFQIMMNHQEGIQLNFQNIHCWNFKPPRIPDYKFHPSKAF